MPHFQDSLTSLEASQEWSEGVKEELKERRVQAMDRARQDYVGTR